MQPPSPPEPQKKQESAPRIPVVDSGRRTQIQAGAGSVLSCYRQIISFELVRLRGTLDRKEFSADLAKSSAAALNRAGNISLDASGFRVGKLVADLDSIIQIINKVAEDLKPAVSSGVDPKNNEHLASAIAMIRDAIDPVVKDTKNIKVRQMLARSFGDGSESLARETFGLILPKLQGFVKDTGNPNGGFVFNGDLAPSMPALAKGDGTVIYLSRGALNGEIETASLAAALIHEGSHTIKNQALYKMSNITAFTVDLFYIERNGHYYLPANMTIINAANYEQVAGEILGVRSGLTDAQASDMHQLKADKLTLAKVLLGCRVTRAWVRANDLITQQTGAENADLAPVSLTDPVLRRAWYSGLFAGVNEVMETVHKTLTLESAANLGDGIDYKVENSRIAGYNEAKRQFLGEVKITLAEGLVKKKSPQELAMLALAVILDQLFGKPSGVLASWEDVSSEDELPKNLSLEERDLPAPAQKVYDLVSGIERRDRPELRTALTGYYGKKAFTGGPG